MVAFIVSVVTKHPEQALALLWVLFVLVSSAMRALPAPTPESRPIYTWFYTSLHIVGANWDKVMAVLYMAFPWLRTIGIDFEK
jgi:hypothetical protein